MVGVRTPKLPFQMIFNELHRSLVHRQGVGVRHEEIRRHVVQSSIGFKCDAKIFSYIKTKSKQRWVNMANADSREVNVGVINAQDRVKWKSMTNMPESWI